MISVLWFTWGVVVGYMIHNGNGFIGAALFVAVLFNLGMYSLFNKLG